MGNPKTKTLIESMIYNLMTNRFTSKAKHRVANLLAHGYEITGADVIVLHPTGPDKSYCVIVTKEGECTRLTENCIFKETIAS